MQFVTITFDQPRRLRFNHNAIADIEDQAQAGIQQLFVERRNFSALRFLVWGGLKYGGDRGITIERAGDLIDAYMQAPGHSIDTLTDELLDALKVCGVWKSATGKDEEGSDNPPTTEATTGATSASAAT